MTHHNAHEPDTPPASGPVSADRPQAPLDRDALLAEILSLPRWKKNRTYYMKKYNLTQLESLSDDQLRDLAKRLSLVEIPIVGGESEEVMSDRTNATRRRGSEDLAMWAGTGTTPSTRTRHASGRPSETTAKKSRRTPLDLLTQVADEALERLQQEEMEVHRTGAAEGPPSSADSTMTEASPLEASSPQHSDREGAAGNSPPYTPDGRPARAPSPGRTGTLTARALRMRGEAEACRPRWKAEPRQSTRRLFDGGDAESESGSDGSPHGDHAGAFGAERRGSVVSLASAASGGSPGVTAAGDGGLRWKLFHEPAFQCRKEEFLGPLRWGAGDSDRAAFERADLQTRMTWARLLRLPLPAFFDMCGPPFFALPCLLLSPPPFESNSAQTGAAGPSSAPPAPAPAQRSPSPPVEC
eukprot:tig00000655_g2836.t1